MRTTLDVDEGALRAAMEAGAGRTKTEAINEALRDYAAPKAAGASEVRG